MTSILVVEDERVIRTSLKKLLESHNYDVTLAGSIDEAQQYDIAEFDLVLSDLRLPGKPGTEMIKLAANTPVLIMTSYASMQSAVDTMKAGAVDYIAKPFNHDELLASIDTILRQHLQVSGAVKTSSSGESTALDAFIGNSSVMCDIYKQIRKVANTNTTVLINGETGTGKELVAKAIHAESSRSNKPIISVNCAAIPETLIESELFGYEKGAFTGANSTRGGLIEAAEGGTLFLDEIGELPLQAQARLLRFLQEGEIRAVGSLETKKVDVRLVAATHRDLKTMAMRGDFREDLFYRIAVFAIALPPLCKRGKDILDLAEAFLREYTQSFGKAKLHFSAKAIQAISTYAWPGNIRELRNAIERATILAESNEIDHELLGIDADPIGIRKFKPIGASERNTDTLAESDNNSVSGSLSLEDYFQRFVLEHQDSMSETELAKKLGISRKCLWERRQRFNIPREKTASAQGK